MGGPVSTPVPTSLPTAVPSPHMPMDVTSALSFVPLWMIWLIVIIAIGVMVGLAFVPASIAKKKGYSYGAFWVFGFFLFIPAIIVAAAIKEKINPPYAQPAYGQPHTQPLQQPYAQPPQATASPESGIRYCTHCGAPMRANGKFCSNCGAGVK